MIVRTHIYCQGFDDDNTLRIAIAERGIDIIKLLEYTINIL